MAIENKLSEILGRKRIKVAELSRQTGLSYKTVLAIRNDKTGGITYDAMDRLCKALDVQPGDLFVYVPDPQ